MTTDPFAHGTPVGDHHTWVRHQNPPCPYCECCTEALCRRAVERDSACHLEGSGDFQLADCPCWRLGTPGFVAFGGRAAAE
jgi:hypothetical protein